VNALVHAELLKLRSTRMVAGLLLAMAALVVITVLATVPTVGATNPPVPLDQPALLARAVGASFGVAAVLMVLLGVLAFTQEFRYGTASSTFLVEPRRNRVLTAKWLALTIASAPITLGTLVLAFTVSIPLIRSRDGNVTSGAELWQVVAAAFVVLAVFGVIGVGVGALVRNQITAIVGVLVWMLAVEQLLTSSYPAVGRWMPEGAAVGLLQLGPAATTKGALLPAPASGIVLAGYTAVVSAFALVVTARRDVL
jgi:ABC-2 type transport system permease protein